MLDNHPVSRFGVGKNRGEMIRRELWEELAVSSVVESNIVTYTIAAFIWKLEKVRRHASEGEMGRRSDRGTENLHLHTWKKPS